MLCESTHCCQQRRLLPRPLESVLRSGTPPPPIPSLKGMRPNSYGLVWDCKAVPWMMDVRTSRCSRACPCSITPWCTACGRTGNRHVNARGLARQSLSKHNQGQPWSLLFCRHRRHPAMRPSGKQRRDSVLSSPRPMLLSMHSLCAILAPRSSLRFLWIPSTICVA